ncbi:origin recognition complex subunit 4, partial [Spiromyces aspiralis]
MAKQNLDKDDIEVLGFVYANAFPTSHPCSPQYHDAADSNQTWESAVDMAMTAPSLSQPVPSSLTAGAPPAKGSLRSERRRMTRGNSSRQNLSAPQITRNILMQRMTSVSNGLSPSLRALVGLDEPYQKVYDLLHRTVTNGESNSALVIGPRGSGKSSIISTALAELATVTSHGQQAAKTHFTVYLNGHIHTTDYLALRDIARQLSIEQNTDELNIRSFSDAMLYILEIFKRGNRQTTSVLFILDEFDLFAQHPKQTLLYTLFDIAQSQQSPIAVVGLTPRLDVLDLLEKRVKSRFSHRQIYVNLVGGGVQQYLEIARQLLTIPDELREVVGDDGYFARFNESVEEMFQDTAFVNVLSSIFNLGKDIRYMIRVFMLPVAKLCKTKPLLDARSFVDAYTRQREDGKVAISR